MIEAALQWAADGVPVFPVAGKVPKTEHGLKDATTDERRISAWWTAWPEAGIGGATGEPCGAWVLDLDGQEGLDSFAELEAIHGRVPETRTVRTGGGGRHLWFLLPDGIAVGNRARVKPGIDVRGTGGYVVLPPSGHPSGGRYRLEVDVPPAFAPEWLLDLVIKRAKPAPAAPVLPTGGGLERKRVLGMVAGACDRIRSASQGTRNDTANRECYSVGGFLDAAGLSVDEVAPLLEAAVVAAEQPAALARRALEEGRKSSRALPPSEPLVARPQPRIAPPAPAAPQAVVPAEPSDTGPAYMRTEDGRPFLIVPPGTAGGWFVATPDGGYRLVRESLVRAELQRHWPDLLVDVLSGDKPRPMKAPELFLCYGADCDSVYYSYTRKTEFRERDGCTGDLFLRVLSPSAPEPVRHKDVLEFFAVLFGGRLDVMLDWLATVDRLDRPTGIPILRGDNSLGKSMVPLGVSRFFGEAITEYDDIFKERFNDALLRCPLVWLDETSHVDSKSGRFRKLSANDRHAIEGKNTPSGTLLGCPRLIVTTNDEDPLQLGREELSKSGEDAIGTRIIVVECRSEARQWLEDRGGREFTADWVARKDGSPGKIPETIAWLCANRRVTPGSRFLVSGDAGAWAASIGSRKGMAATVLDAYAAYLAMGAKKRAELPSMPFLFDEAIAGYVLIGNQALRECWQALLGERAPSHRKVADALGKLAPRGNEKVTLSSGERVPGYLVPRHLLPKEDDAC